MEELEALAQDLAEDSVMVDSAVVESAMAMESATESVEVIIINRDFEPFKNPHMPL